ncbi:MAG: primosomal protein DnaI [Turicibacter sp.]|nr:primosomal protein DnaI [Turicibacter sp.]
MKSIKEIMPQIPGAQEAFREILDMPKISQAFKENEGQVDMDLLPSFISDLDEFVRGDGLCKGCRSLNECRQPVKGHAPRLSPHLGRLKVSYAPCNYQKNQAHLENIHSFHMPQDILKADFTNFFMDPSRSVAHEKALMFIHGYLMDKKGKGLYLHGPFGTGKTYLLAAIASTLSRMGVVCGLVYFPELIAEIKAGFNDPNSSSYEKVEQLKEIQVLMLDDIGSESMTSWMRDEVLGRILNYRMHQGLPTFFTSNLDYQELQQHFSVTQKGEVEAIKGARILERIKALTTPVKLAGTNYREKL